jgi:hypothetical protein
MPECICHVKVNAIQRSAGRSVTAAVGYRTGDKIKDIRTGETFDYTRKQGVEHAENILPANIKKKYTTEELWNAAEAAERKSNSVVGREYVVAIPSELDPAERRKLAVDFATHIVEKYNVAANVAVHAPGRHGDDRNYHAHIMTSTRVLTPEGFGEKTRILDVKQTSHLEIRNIRETWAAMSNEALERAGSYWRMNPLSFAERGLDRVPEVHLGPEATAMERRGIATAKGDRNREIKALNTLIAERDRQKEEVALQESAATAREAQRATELWEAQNQFERAVTNLSEIKKRGWEVGENDCAEVIQAGMNLLSCDIAVNGGGYPEARARLPHVEDSIRDAKIEAFQAEKAARLKAAARLERAELERQAERDRAVVIREGREAAEDLPNLAPRTPVEAPSSPEAIKSTLGAKENELGPSARVSRPKKLRNDLSLEELERFRNGMYEARDTMALKIAKPDIATLEERSRPQRELLEAKKKAAEAARKEIEDNPPGTDILDRIAVTNAIFGFFGQSLDQKNERWGKSLDEAIKLEKEANDALNGHDELIKAERERIQSVAKDEAAKRMPPELARNLAEAERRIEEIREREAKANQKADYERRMALKAKLEQQEADRRNRRGRGVSR